MPGLAVAAAAASASAPPRNRKTLGTCVIFIVNRGVAVRLWWSPGSQRFTHGQWAPDPGCTSVELKSCLLDCDRVPPFQCDTDWFFRGPFARVLDGIEAVSAAAAAWCDGRNAAGVETSIQKRLSGEERCERRQEQARQERSRGGGGREGAPVQAGASVSLHRRCVVCSVDTAGFGSHG